MEDDEIYQVPDDFGGEDELVIDDRDGADQRPALFERFAKKAEQIQKEFSDLKNPEKAW